MPATLPVIRSRLLAAALALCAGPAAAFGGAGSIGECASFTSCTAALASAASWNVRESLTERTPGYNLPFDMVEGVASHGETEVVSDSATVVSARLKLNSSIGPFFINASARAQSGFGINRAHSDPGVGVSGVHAPPQNGSARIGISTFAEGSSAWRDVWRFSGAGHFSAGLLIDGGSQVISTPNLPPFFDFTTAVPSAEWFFVLRVWDVTHLSVSEDFELGGPTLVTRVTGRNDAEQRSSFAAALSLDFDFEADTQYVVTAELRASSRNGRALDLFNTVRLVDVALSDGASMTALSGHDYVQGVPEPGTLGLGLLGLVAVALAARRQHCRT